MFREAKALLATAGVELIHAIAVRNPADLNAEVGALISSGAKMVIVGGGDGSVSGSVDSFVDKDCIFALLPLGTANSFARSEEHTSELQSLMRISYAVFCLKKKKTNKQ